MVKNFLSSEATAIYGFPKASGELSGILPRNTLGNSPEAIKINCNQLFGCFLRQKGERMTHWRQWRSWLPFSSCSSFLVSCFSGHPTSRDCLPPGPRPRPFLGNVLQIDSKGFLKSFLKVRWGRAVVNSFQIMRKLRIKLWVGPWGVSWKWSIGAVTIQHDILH